MQQAGCSILAPAKINLSLRVRGRLPDGYHALESLVAFADIGDRLEICHAERFRFEVRGAFADALQVDDNLVCSAHRTLEKAVGRPLPCHIHLEKNLPVAAGLGGGSADAAAALVGLVELFDLSLTHEALLSVAASLGADVPVCLAATAAWMTGIGHDVCRLPDLPMVDIVLVNPRISLPTGTIFKALAASSTLSPAQAAPHGFDDLAALLTFMEIQGNDLTPPAIDQVSTIGDCLAALEQAGGLGVAMSGSGATCFALARPGQGAAIRAAYAGLRPQDWVAAGCLIHARQ